MKNLPEALNPYLFHYYRAETQRETEWRNRLDVTTNWSIVSTAAIISYAFSTDNVPHGVILIAYMLVWFFLYIESRRFRIFLMLRRRTRLIEQHALAPMFDGRTDQVELNEKMRELAENLDQYSAPITKLEAIAWRVRRIYIFIFVFILFAWIVKLTEIPVTSLESTTFIDNAKLWFFPGKVVFWGIVFSLVSILGLSFYLPRKSVESDLP